MPAINLSQLRIQAAKLADVFADPTAFMVLLNEILDHYTNWTMRRSLVYKRMNVLTHHTPLPVLKQIEMEIAPLAEKYPEEGVKLTQALWSEGSLESRLLAAKLLGEIPLDAAMTALSRLPDWLSATTDADIKEALLTHSLKRLRIENPLAFFELLKTWLASPRSSLQVWGYRALIPALTHKGFDNLPVVFSILRPAIAMAGPATQTDLLVCLQALEKVSITETIYFMRELLLDDPDAMFLRTVRRILPGLDPKTRSSLRMHLSR